jgi:hypothetical protein
LTAQFARDQAGYTAEQRKIGVLTNARQQAQAQRERSQALDVSCATAKVMAAVPTRRRRSRLIASDIFESLWLDGWQARTRPPAEQPGVRLLSVLSLAELPRS